MKAIVKRFRLKAKWEVLMIDRKVWFLAKDILDYFDYSETSQGTIRSSIHDKEIEIISGPPVQLLRNIRTRAMVVSLKGLSDFAHSREGHRKQKGIDLMEYVTTRIMPDMSQAWNKKFKTDQMEVSEEKQIDLFEVEKDVDTADMMQKIATLENRVKHLEQTVKELQLKSLVADKGDKRVIDADALMEYLKRTDNRGNV